MKLLKLFPLIVFLGGCNYFPGESTPSEVEDESQAAERPTPPESASSGQVTTEDSKAGDDAKPEEEYYLPVADWLVQRKTVCQQDNDAINTQLERYRQSFSDDLPPGEHAQIVQAYSQLKALMLASCDPARTPGLLKNFLDAITDHSHWPPEYTALFDLLQSEYQAYSLLEKKHRDLEARHQKTIDGIGNIEKSLESQVDPRNEQGNGDQAP